MASVSLANIVATLLKQGYEARPLGEAGITVWKDGGGAFFSTETLTSLNGSILQEVDKRLKNPE